MFGDAVAMQILCLLLGRTDDGLLFRNISDVVLASRGNMPARLGPNDGKEPIQPRLQQLLMALALTATREILTGAGKNWRMWRIVVPTKLMAGCGIGDSRRLCLNTCAAKPTNRNRISDNWPA
jgi:hypothetical protein